MAISFLPPPFNILMYILFSEYNWAGAPHTPAQYIFRLNVMRYAYPNREPQLLISSDRYGFRMLRINSSHGVAMTTIPPKQPTKSAIGFARKPPFSPSVHSVPCTQLLMIIRSLMCSIAKNQLLTWKRRTANSAPERINSILRRDSSPS